MTIRRWSVTRPSACSRGHDSAVASGTPGDSPERPSCLGSAPAGVLRLVLRRVALLVGIGIVAGTAISLWATRFVATLLFGLDPRDPGTFAAACVLLAVVGAMAGWIPARRAARLDPARVLREG